MHRRSCGLWWKPVWQPRHVTIFPSNLPTFGRSRDDNARASAVPTSIIGPNILGHKWTEDVAELHHAISDARLHGAEWLYLAAI